MRAHQNQNHILVNLKSLATETPFSMPSQASVAGIRIRCTVLYMDGGSIRETLPDRLFAYLEFNIYRVCYRLLKLLR